MTKNNFRNFLIAAGLIVCVPVNAAMVTINLDRSNVGTFLPDGLIYATVTLADGADAMAGHDVTFTVDVVTDTDPTTPTLTPGSNFGIQKFTFNDINNLVTSFVGLSSIGWGTESNRNGDGFGLFDYRLKATGSSRVDPLVFGVLAAGATISDFISLSTGGRSSPFAAHIAGFTDVDSGTGVVNSAWFGVVPIPAAVWLFVSGLGLLGFLGRRHRQAATA
ncbi:MAG: hypothetical protein OEQ18_11810 [Gammaproteobacteria bacterium]|nr:hypothetical protein [Gammaproteobacteria bacterium]